MAETPSQRPTVVVTGSGGFLGSAIAGRLAAGYRVFGFGFDMVLPKRPQEGVEPVEVDLTSDESVAAALHQVRAAAGPEIASVIHLAAYYDLSGDPDPRYEAVTVQGSRRAMRHLQRLRTGPFIFASTLLVHRATEPGRPIDES